MFLQQQPDTIEGHHNKHIIQDQYGSWKKQKTTKLVILKNEKMKTKELFFKATTKNEKMKNMKKTKKTPKNKFYKTDPPNHLPWSWIISKKLQKRPTTLIRIHHYTNVCIYIYTLKI